MMMDEYSHIQNSGVVNPTSEEYLRDVTVGEREPVNSTIYLAPYDPQWPSLYSQLADRVHRALGEGVLLLEHVGSTSIEGLSAKPIIDMVLVVVDSADEDSYVPQLEQVGFVLKIREPDWFQHRMFKAPDGAGNLHVFSKGCEEVNRMIAFRDWLRTNDADRMLYENAKVALAAREWKYTQHYADAKSKVIQEILRRALNTSKS